MSEAAEVPRYVRATKWIWIVCSALTVVSGAAVSAADPEPLALALAGLAVVQAAVAIPCAFVLVRGKRWARLVLLVLAAFSLGGLGTALQQQAWGSLVLNAITASTFFLLRDPGVRPHFGLPADPWLRRKVRGTSAH